MNIERLPLIRRGTLAIALAVATCAVAGCSGDSDPDEVQRLKSRSVVAAAQEDVRNQQRDILEADGFLGYHKLQLVKPKREETTTSTASGEYQSDNDSLFLLVVGGSDGDASGSFEAETSTEITRFVRLAWEVNNDTRDTIVSDFLLSQVIVRDATEESDVSLEFVLDQDALIDFEGSRERVECIYIDDPEAKDPTEYFVPAQDGCLRPTDLDFADEYITYQNETGRSLVRRVVLYLDEQARNQYFAAIGEI